MVDSTFAQENRALIKLLVRKKLSSFDLLPHQDMREKLVDLVLNDIPKGTEQDSATLLAELRQKLTDTKVDKIKVVVFGGGTGLSNIIGGDCRQSGWEKRPFQGLKQVFPDTRAVVCITDDGGSTGELLKDVPIFALGDIRHVMLSSIQLAILQQKYDLNDVEALKLITQLSILFNFRFHNNPASPDELIRQAGLRLDLFPPAINAYVQQALSFCYGDELSRATIARSHCLGNLLILAAIRKALPERQLREVNLKLDKHTGEAIYDALAECADIFGAARDSVLPCTVTPAQLRFHYTDGVQVTGEMKSGIAERGFPVDRVVVDFCDVPYVSERVFASIRSADILIMAPGSLYSSIIPVLQVPGIAAAVRKNRKALKLLISNLWVQAGETDRSITDPERKFYVSDMIKAYDSNIPGGTPGLFDHVLCLSLQDVPASVIQNYTIEGKIPIYLDRETIRLQGAEPVECGFFSREAMLERQVIQHDPHVVAKAVKAIYLARRLFPKKVLTKKSPGKKKNEVTDFSRRICTPSYKYRKLTEYFSDIPVRTGRKKFSIDADEIRRALINIIWLHQDIPVGHLNLIAGITCVPEKDWGRDQSWDNIFSFYDPEDQQVKIREDRFDNPKRLEVAFLIAVGQSLLGNYAAEKKIEPLLLNSIAVGRVYHLHLRKKSCRSSYFNDAELRMFLQLARMIEQERRHFTRAINGNEGFTPPGLLMGLMYVWYLDNRLASHIEYKMSIMKVRQTDLIPDQKIMRNRREMLTGFFREVVFGKSNPV